MLDKILDCFNSFKPVNHSTLKSRISRIVLFIRTRRVFHCRTKWKRQNQLRLEQLRHQATVEKDLLVRSVGLHHGSIDAYCSPYNTQTQTSHPPPPPPPPPAPSTASTAAFLSTAAALFRNVTYVHGCPL